MYTQQKRNHRPAIARQNSTSFDEVLGQGCSTKARSNAASER